MKINFNSIINTFYSGTLVKEDGNPFTLKDASIESLLNEKVPEQKDKLIRFDLAIKLRDSKEEQINLSSEEISIIKEAINKNYGTLIFAQCYKILEGEM